MKQEDKELLIKDLCARLPYGVKAITKTNKGENVGKIISVSTKNNIILGELYNGKECFWLDYGSFKPYLRPLETITKEERIELGKEIQKDKITPYGEIKDEGVDNLLLCTIRQSTYFQEWLLSKHFDFRGLIKKGLALAAPEGMYN